MDDELDVKSVESEKALCTKQCSVSSLDSCLSRGNLISFHTPADLPQNKRL